MQSLEDRIGYKFTNSLLLAEAVTHPSLAYEAQSSQFDNQRLEYLGDAVLQLVLTNHLFHLFPEFAEGRLTKLRSRLVSRSALAKFARNLELGEYLQMGRGEGSSGGRERSSNLADAFEALVGAIYLDGRIDAAERFILDQCSDAIDHITREPEEVNPKGELQELLQAISATSPSYHVIDESGPAHEKHFEIRVEWETQLLGEGRGASKKEAEINAASDALKKRVWVQADHKV
jgi:ribonuclease-3